MMWRASNQQQSTGWRRGTAFALMAFVLISAASVSTLWAQKGKSPVLAKAVPATDSITRLILDRKYEDAIKRSNEQLERTSALMALRLYQQAVAQLYLAMEKDNDEKLLKDAGLNFMRVRVYFSGTPYFGAATLEAGRVHHLLGRHDIARRLYNQAQDLIDKKDDPELKARLDSLQKQLPE